MKIASIAKKQNQNFQGCKLNSKKLLKVLEFAADKNALITAGSSVVFSAVLRPAVTMLTPNTPERDKKYAAAKSMASAVAIFATTGFFTKKISSGLDIIAKNKNKYLNKKTLESLKDGAASLSQSKKYQTLDQLLRYSSEVLAIVPKLFLTTVLITPFANLLIKNKENKNTETKIAKPELKREKQSFKGKGSRKTAEVLAKIMNNEKIQNFAGKIKNKRAIEYAMYLKDALATLVFAGFVKANKTIDQKDKGNLIANTAVSTALCTLGSVGINQALKTPLAKLEKQFRMANVGDILVEKYINGAKVIKNALILSVLYYGILPMISTYIGSRISNNNDNKQN